MTGPISHFIFSDSAAGSLKQALRQARRRDRVFCLLDDLSFGPIDPPDPATRLAWIERELMLDLGDHAPQIERLDAFWRAAGQSMRRLVWFSRRDAREHVDFLEWVWRMGGAAYDVVEFDEAEVTFHRPDGRTARATVNSLALLPPEHLVAAHYWNSAKPLDAAARDRYRASWARLRRENAPLRVLDPSGLASAPFSFFDDFVLSCIPEGWRKIGRVVGEAIAKLYDEPFRQTGAWVLRARVLKLAETGRIDIRGELSLFGDGEVRLAAGDAR
jgi:hypothetical protein